MKAAYLARLSKALRDFGVDQPVAVVDLDRLDANCRTALTGSDQALGRRLVAKSLPCLPLLDHIRELVPTAGLMTFSEAMLQSLLLQEPDTDHLLGKPLPVSSAARVLERCPDAGRRVQWLIDTQARLSQYLALAGERGTPVRLSLEIDVGLHRGGMTAAEVARAVDEIAAHPLAELSGVMGYEAHLAKMPHIFRGRSKRIYAQSYGNAVAALGADAQGLCRNTGGSLTFQDYATGGAANEVAFGSVLVKPSDFDHSSTLGFSAAVFIATPILKVMVGNPWPGLEFLNLRRRTDLAILGGHYLAQPVYPSGFSYSGVFGRSSNQEVWSGPSQAQVHPDDVALLRPSQSEAVLNQFGTVLAVRNGAVVAEWPTLPS